MSWFTFYETTAVSVPTPAANQNSMFFDSASNVPSYKDDAGVVHTFAGLTNPMTTAGDIIYGGVGGAPARLAVGTNGFVLTLVAGLPAWVAASGGAYTGTTNRITITGSAIDISATYVGQTSLTTLGTVTTGTWNGTTIAVANGGTGQTTLAAAATALQANGLDADACGFRGIPQNSQSGNYTTVAADAGKEIYHPSGAGAGDTFTIDSNANVAYEIGSAISFCNMDSNALSIAIATDTMYLAGAGTTGTRTLAQFGTATASKKTSTTWLISGINLT